MRQRGEIAKRMGLEDDFWDQRMGESPAALKKGAQRRQIFMGYG